MTNSEGYVEQISTSQVRGWIYITDSPETHLSIVVTQGLKTLGTAVANLYRDDLRAAGIGFGDHAFVVNFQEILGVEDLTSIEIRAICPDASMILLDRTIDIKSALTVARVEDRPIPTRDRSGGQTPLFILGAARSGTSALAQSLLQSRVYEGFEEGHLLDLAGILIKAVREFYENNAEELQRDTLISQIPIRVVDEGIKDQFRLISRLKFLGDRWLDKTPRRSMIRHAEFLMEIWPDAKFIFMKRRAIENISSRKRKFSTTPFKESCDDWSGAMRDWREVKPLLGASVIEVEQLEMALHPATVAATISKFLVLNAWESQRFARTLAAEQPERTSPRFAEILDFDKLEWTEEEKKIFKLSCNDEMVAYGYSFHLNYYR